MKEDNDNIELLATVEGMSEEDKNRAATAITEKISEIVKETHDKTGWSNTIPDYRLPLGLVIEQLGGKGGSVTVAYHPNSRIGRRLLKEMEYRYVAILDRDVYDVPDYDDCFSMKEQAIVEMLNGLPWLRNQFRVADGWVGAEVHGPNAIVDMDFIVIDKLERTHLHRYTDENVSKICKDLGVQFYQSKKRKG